MTKRKKPEIGDLLYTNSGTYNMLGMIIGMEGVLYCVEWYEDNYPVIFACYNEKTINRFRDYYEKYRYEIEFEEDEK